MLSGAQAVARADSASKQDGSETLLSTIMTRFSPFIKTDHLSNGSIFDLPSSTTTPARISRVAKGRVGSEAQEGVARGRVRSEAQEGGFVQSRPHWKDFSYCTKEACSPFVFAVSRVSTSASKEAFSSLSQLILKLKF